METGAKKIGSDPIFRTAGKWGLTLLLLASAPAGAFDVNGVALGASEAELLKAFPKAHCKEMDWKTDAADRRCDEAPVRLAGADARITFYLKKGVLQAFDARFGEKDLRGVLEHLKERYGKPESEGPVTYQRRGDARTIYRASWERGGEHAVLSSMTGRHRVDLSVWRGKFDTEIYRIR
jgi:hypothetical protein